MNGHDFVATTTLMNSDGGVLVEAGDTCGDVPTESLAWLSEQGIIVPADAASVTPDPAPAPVSDDSVPVEDSDDSESEE